MKLHIFCGPALSGKTDHLLSEMQRAHHEDPLSYIFLGPSGVFVKEFSEWFARSIDSSIPRDSFLVIDQFAVELHRRSHRGRMYVDRVLQKVMIAHILRSAEDDELGCFCPFKESLELVGFVSEAVREAKDEGEEELLTRLCNDQARSLVHLALMELNSRNDCFFDTSDAYRGGVPEGCLCYLGVRSPRRLFMDGFSNLSNSQMIFLSRIIPLFDEAYLTADIALMDREGWSGFMEMLKAQNVQIDGLQPGRSRVEALPMEAVLNPHGPPVSLLGSPIQVVQYRDPEEELIQVCREIKRLIIDEGTDPGEIAVVLNNFSERALEFSAKLEEYGVPVSLRGEEPLSSSVSVQLTLLPFQTALAGYPPHMLISLLDHGLGLSTPMEFDLMRLERLAISAGLSMGPRKSSLDGRRAEWRDKLEGHLATLMERWEAVSQDEAVYEEELRDQEADIELCQMLLKTAEELFASLEGIELAMSERMALRQHLDELSTWASLLKGRLQGHPELECEAAAIGKLEGLRKKMDAAIGSLGEGELDLSEFMAYVELLLDGEAYGQSPSLANGVEILSLHSARFRHRAVKFIVNFNDGIYPHRWSNPLYSLDGRGKYSYHRIKGREAREALYTCLCASSKAIITYPRASREGEPLVKSLWLDGWRDDRTKGPQKLTSPMSDPELKVEFGLGLARGEKVDLPPEFLDHLRPLKEYADSIFSWRIRDRRAVEILLGEGISYTKLSEFKGCPYRFFLNRVMGLEETAGHDGWNLSPMERGVIYHSCLKELYDRFQEGGRLDVARGSGKVREVVEEIIYRFSAADSIRSLRSVKAAMIDDVASIVQGYLDFEMADPAKASIGERTLTELPFRLCLSEMERVMPQCAKRYGGMVLRGRIDRVDLNVAEKKKVYDLVLSDYKSGSSGDWDQLKLYTVGLLCLNHREIPRDPKLSRSFFRMVNKGCISKRLDAFPREGRMDLDTRPKSTLSFGDVDLWLLDTLDGIFEGREYLPGRLAGSTKSCYRCGHKVRCVGLGEP